MAALIQRRHAIAGLIAGTWAIANAQPRDHQLRILVGYPPGGTTDMMARLIAQNLNGRGITSTIVENRVGASGRIALDALRRSAADGATLVMTPDFPLTVFPHIYRKLGYDPKLDFASVMTCGTSDFALCVGPAVPQQVVTANDFIAWCRSNPKLALYASPSPGSTPHFTGVLFASAAKTDLTHVAYKGGAQAIQDVLGSQVPASINPVAELLPHLAAGKLRVLASTGSQRSRFLPQTPTFLESGYPEVVVSSWIGLLAPVHTSENVLERLRQDIAQALGKDALVTGFAKFGISVQSVVGEDMRGLIQKDTLMWASVVKASGFAVDE